MKSIISTEEKELLIKQIDLALRDEMKYIEEVPSKLLRILDLNKIPHLPHKKAMNFLENKSFCWKLSKDVYVGFTQGVNLKHKTNYNSKVMVRITTPGGSVYATRNGEPGSYMYSCYTAHVMDRIVQRIKAKNRDSAIRLIMKTGVLNGGIPLPLTRHQALHFIESGVILGNKKDELFFFKTFISDDMMKEEQKELIEVYDYLTTLLKKVTYQRVSQEEHERLIKDAVTNFLEFFDKYLHNNEKQNRNIN